MLFFIATVQPNPEDLTRVLGFTTREVTLIGFLMVCLIVLCYTVFRLYKDKKIESDEHQKTLKTERDALLQIINNNNDAIGKVRTALEVIKEKLS